MTEDGAHGRFGFLIPLLGALVFVAVWEAACQLLKIRPVLLPPPSAILAELLASPLWATLGVLGLLFALLGRRRAATAIGYSARD